MAGRLLFGWSAARRVGDDRPVSARRREYEAALGGVYPITESVDSHETQNIGAANESQAGQIGKRLRHGKGNRMTDVGGMPSNRVNYRRYGVGRFLLTDMYVAGTILDMKSLPLTMFARNWVRPMNRARGLLIGAMVAVMCGCASLVAPAAVDADIPCQRWRFDGYTEFGLADGGKITFVSFDEWIDSDRSIETWAIPPNGGAASQTMIWGGVRNGNVIWMTRRTNLGENPLWLNGGVTDDGFAYGIAFDIHDHSSSWRSAAPLKCV